MHNRPRLLRSIPFWVLVAGSIVSVVAGVLITVDRLSVMTTALTVGTATGVEVYVGQSWVVFAAALVAAGLVGLVAALALLAARSFVGTRPAEAVVPTAQNAAESDADDSAPVTTVDAADAKKDADDTTAVGTATALPTESDAPARTN